MLWIWTQVTFARKGRKNCHLPGYELNLVTRVRSKFFSVLLMNWTFSDQLNFDKAKNGYRKSRMCSWFLFLLRFLNTESENVDRRSTFLRTYFSSTGQDLFFVLSSLRYVFSPRNPGVKLFAPFPQYIWSVNSFLIPWNKDNNKLRGIKAASARFLDFRERTYPLFKNKISIYVLISRSYCILW